ncbi:MAG: transcriptional regulator [bacterium]|nr:transcriptional regulator [bacterium]
MFESPGELLRKIQLGEDSTIELKAVVFKGSRVAGPDRRQLADELAAIANTADGVLVLGVDDETRDIIGIPRERLDAVEKYVLEACNDSIKPPLAVRLIRMELPDTLGELRPIIKIDVPRSLFVHESPGGYFQRSGSWKRKLSPEALARLFQQRSQVRLIRFDEQTVPETTAADLEEVLWLPFIGPHTTDPIGTLHKMKLLTLDERGCERATVAGVLTASAHPEERLPGALVEAVRYRGVHQDSNYQIDSARIVGPLPRQIDEALAFARRNMRVAAVKDPTRTEVPQFSIRAMFEAIVNAVAHRDYSIHGSKIRMFLFDDRLELYSPGALANTVTVDSLALRQSTRNETISSVLGRCPVGERAADAGRRFFMESRGDGVPIILRESSELAGREPTYRVIADSELLLTIWSAPPP